MKKGTAAGLDIGFGDTKLVIHGGAAVKIPSAVAHAREAVLSGEGLGETGIASEYIYNGSAFIVGDLAKEDAIETKTFDFLRKYGPLLAYHALRAANAEGIKTLAIGVPLEWYNQQNNTILKNSMKNATFFDDERLSKFGIEKIEVYPQGVGCLLDYQLDEKGEPTKNENITAVVLDVGTNTVDVVAMINGVTSKPDSYMMPGDGLTIPLRDLATAIEKTHKITLTEQETKEVCSTGHLLSRGNTHKYGDVIASIMERYAEHVLGRIFNRSARRMKKNPTIILAGGGAYYLKNHIPAEHKGNLHIPDDPEFANARGFLKAIIAAANGKEA